MSGYWLVWCPICCELRPSRIPARTGADVDESRAVAAEYDAHMRKHRERP